MDNDEFEAFEELAGTLLRTTVSLMRTDQPGRGSGFVISWGTELRVVTACHVIRTGEWAVETVSDQPTTTDEDLRMLPLESRKTLLLRLAADRNSLTASTHDIAWATLDVDFDVLRADSKAASRRLPIYRGPLDALPTAEEIYTFAALNRDEWHLQAQAIVRETAYEAWMTYEGEDVGGLRFRLARNHQGHNYYYGASGAPVADRTGAIVGVLTGPGREKDELLVASLARFIHAMQAGGGQRS